MLLYYINNVVFNLFNVVFVVFNVVFNNNIINIIYNINNYI